MPLQFGFLQFSSRPSAIVSALRRLGFWVSILLPVTYLPVLYGMRGTNRLITLSVLVSLNIVCLMIGHRYSP